MKISNCLHAQDEQPIYYPAMNDEVATLDDFDSLATRQWSSAYEETFGAPWEEPPTNPKLRPLWARLQRREKTALPRNETKDELETEIVALSRHASLRLKTTDHNNEYFKRIVDALNPRIRAMPRGDGTLAYVSEFPLFEAETTRLIERLNAILSIVVGAENLWHQLPSEMGGEGRNVGETRSNSLHDCIAYVLVKGGLVMRDDYQSEDKKARRAELKKRIRKDLIRLHQERDLVVHREGNETISIPNADGGWSELQLPQVHLTSPMTRQGLGWVLELQD